ncbi:alpha/beta hydrolase [Pantoea sp. MBD-2R]|uniref:alpha/beta fold hydrolase n=1 Tax=Pantoea sp. MBD-2R TaxID=3141540 RepID=UPI003183B5E8
MLHTSGIPRLSYHAEGKGPLVIMLHGLLMDRKSWKDSGLISVLSPFFHIVCPDLIGHGESEKTNVEEFYTQQKQALSIVKIMDELGYKKAHVIGYSAGAWVALGSPERHEDADKKSCQRQQKRMSWEWAEGGSTESHRH